MGRVWSVWAPGGVRGAGAAAGGSGRMHARSIPVCLSLLLPLSVSLWYPGMLSLARSGFEAQRPLPPPGLLGGERVTSDRGGFRDLGRGAPVPHPQKAPPGLAPATPGAPAHHQPGWAGAQAPSGLAWPGRGVL